MPALQNRVRIRRIDCERQRIADQPPSHGLRCAFGGQVPKLPTARPKTTETRPASARSQRPCASGKPPRGRDQQCAGSDRPYRWSAGQTATAAIAGQSRTTPATERLIAPSKISVCHISPRRIARMPATMAMAPSAARYIAKVRTSARERRPGQQQDGDREHQREAGAHAESPPVARPARHSSCQSANCRRSGFAFVGKLGCHRQMLSNPFPFRPAAWPAPRLAARACSRPLPPW